MIRKIINIPIVNLVGRFVLKKLRGWINALTEKWRISGIIDVAFAGVKYKIYSNGDDTVHSLIYYRNEYVEADEIEVFARLSPLLEVFIDVGSNIGIFPLVGMSVNSNLKCICFEPHLPNVRRLKKNLELNGLEGRATVVPKAVGDKTQVISFTVPSDERIIDTASANEGWAMSFYQNKVKYKTIAVEQCSLDDYLHEFPVKSVDFIKIDVETYEYEVLIGARKTLALHRPFVLCEIFYFAKNIQKIEDFFRELGYTFWCVGKGVLLEVKDIRSSPEAKNFLFVPFEYRSRTNQYNAIFTKDSELSDLGEAFLKSRCKTP